MQNLKALLYCWRSGRGPHVGRRYCDMFVFPPGVPRDVILCINDVPRASQRDATRQEALAEVAQDGFTVTETFFMPSGGLAHMTTAPRDILTAIARRLQSPLPAPITYQKGALSALSRQFVALIIACEESDAYQQVERKVFDSAGMAMGEEKHPTWTCPPNHYIVSTRIDEYAVCDDWNNGFSRITVVGQTVLMHARMPQRGPGAFGTGPGQWRDAAYFVTHKHMRDDASHNALAALRAQYPAVWAEISAHLTFYKQWYAESP